MKQFDVCITETLEKIVPVYADTKREAQEQVEQDYQQGKIVLASEELTDVSFSTEEHTKEIQGLLIQPGEYPVEIRLHNDLETLQEFVGGDIEETILYEDSVSLVLNEEGKLEGKEFNRSLRLENGEVYDFIAGTFLVLGTDGEEFVSLTQEQMDAYEAIFHQPETCINIGSSLMVVELPQEYIRCKSARDPEKASLRKPSKQEPSL